MAEVKLFILNNSIFPRQDIAEIWKGVRQDRNIFVKLYLETFCN